MYKSIFNVVVVVAAVSVFCIGCVSLNDLNDIAIFSELWAKAWGKASAKAKLTDVPKVLVSFESAYLAAVAENVADTGFAENHLVFFKLPIDNKLFKYEYVTYAQGGIVGLKATALSDVGEFAKGGFLQTVYHNDSETFTHCVGGKGSNIGVAGELIPHFNASGVDCGSVEIKTVRASANIDRRLVNAEGEAWTGYAMRTFYSAVFRSDGTFTKTDSYGYGMDCKDGSGCNGEEECGVCTYEETGIWHTHENKITMKYNGEYERTEIEPYTITSSDGKKLDELTIGEFYEYQLSKRQQ